MYFTNIRRKLRFTMDLIYFPGHHGLLGHRDSEQNGAAGRIVRPVVEPDAASPPIAWSSPPQHFPSRRCLSTLLRRLRRLFPLLGLRYRRPSLRPNATSTLSWCGRWRTNSSPSRALLGNMTFGSCVHIQSG
jgi:hypothetical protein